MSFSRRRFLTALGSAPLLASCRASTVLNAFAQHEDNLRLRLADDPLRPQCHLLPAKNWMNDPNGPIYWRGQYHMFFQYNPNAAVWGDMHWAHAVSPDMIHWRHLPIALAPTPGWDDADGCFTGSAVNDNGVATVLYTGVKNVPVGRATLRDGVHNFREVQCLATSTHSQLQTWTKWKTPVVQPPDDPQLTGFRDPFLWRDHSGWYLGIGSGVRKAGGRVLLYRSKDLRRWEYLHPLATGKWTGKENVNLVDSGEMWECPDFFALGKKNVLLYSTAGSVIWEVGELDRKEMRFYPQRSGLLDHGAYYAQKTQLDAEGQRILWGWIPERRPEAEHSAAGWAGCMALPRVLSLNAENQLEMRVAGPAQSLRGREVLSFTLDSSSEAREKMLAAARIENLAGEVKWKIIDGPFSMTLADNAGTWWSLSIEKEGTDVALQINRQKIVVPKHRTKEMEFHLLLDASVAEFFCHNMHVVTTRIYRKPEGSLQIQIANEDAARVTSMRAWQLRPISADRLTT